jgi:hypothetical protein
MSELLLDRAGRRRSRATTPGFHAGRPLRNKGRRYPADPPKVEEIIAVMHAAGDGGHGRRLRGLIVILWRGCASKRRSPYLQGIDNAEIIDTVHARRAPMIPVSPSHRL